MNILEVQDLCKTYGKGEAAVQALRHATFSVRKGSPADSDTLLLATGELTGKMMTAFGQSQNIQQLVDKPLVWLLVVNFPGCSHVWTGRYVFEKHDG